MKGCNGKLFYKILCKIRLVYDKITSKKQDDELCLMINDFIGSDRSVCDEIYNVLGEIIKDNNYINNRHLMGVDGEYKDAWDVDCDNMDVVVGKISKAQDNMDRNILYFEFLLNHYFYPYDNFNNHIRVEFVKKYNTFHICDCGCIKKDNPRFMVLNSLIHKCKYENQAISLGLSYHPNLMDFTI